jgi:eukaryotic-like serine/threonine-protein kinase
MHGGGSALKEWTIGVQVFDRDSSFDPRLDPIVRVQARKLRTRLKEYYESDGAHDSLWIEFPKGSYVPLIHANAGQRAPKPPQERHMGRGAGASVARRATAICIVAVALTAVATIVTGRLATVQQRSIVKPRQVTFRTGSTTDPAISRDGKLLAYSSDRGGTGGRDIWVQPLRGGIPVRLTSNSAHEITPDFAPDGSRIVYRSFRDGGGIYSVSVLGGEETKLVSGGFLPRFSPDGSQIVYTLIEESGSSSVYIEPVAGGEALKVSSGTTSAGCAVWARGGKYVLFRASDGSGFGYDFWIVPVNVRGTVVPGWPKRTGVADALKRQNLPPLHGASCPADWLDEHLIFPVDQQLWRIPISRTTWEVAGPAMQILQGPVADRPRAIAGPSGSNRVVYSVGNPNSHIWSFPINVDKGTPAGVPQQLTSDSSIRSGLEGTRARLSLDGRTLLFDSLRGGTRDLWVKDLVTGTESPVDPSGKTEPEGLLNPSGSRVIYRVKEGGSNVCYIRDLVSGRARVVYRNCGLPKDWSADEKYLLTVGAQALSVIDVATGTRRPLVNNPEFTPKEATFSPDGKWIALSSGRRGYKALQAIIAPFSNTPVDPSRFDVLTTDPYHLSLHWALNGNLIYFFHQRDGFRCLWAQKLDPKTKRVVGEPFVVHHFHRAQRYPWGGSWISVASDRIAVTLTDSTSNIWYAEISR